MKQNLVQKKLALVLTGAIAASSMAIPASAVTVDNSYIPGTYSGVGLGHEDEEVAVKVTLAEVDGNVVITDIDADGSTQTPKFWNKAIAIVDVIKEKNGTDGVDAISGATHSSDGIIGGVNDALNKALGSGIFAYGRGTEYNPYVINTVDQLEAFALSVDDGTDYAGEYIALGEDISLAGTASWNPIGAEGKASANAGKLFAGHFDGQGHTISSMTINDTYSDEANVGLFSTLAATAEVKNLVMTDVDIDAAAKDDSSFVIVRAGAITGDTARSSSRGTIINGCSVSGSVKCTAKDGSAFAGGIAGRIFTYSAVINSVSYADVTASGNDEYAAAYTGGLIGLTGNNTVLANCASFGNIVSANTAAKQLDGAYAGGLAGMLSSVTYNCYATGNVTISRNASAKHDYAGILAGQAAGSAVGEKNYFANDAVITINADDETTTPDAAAWFDTSIEGLVTAEPGVAKTETETAAFADTLNSNLYAVFKALNEDTLAMREWELSGGRVVPSSREWINSTVDDSIFESGDGTQEDPYIIMTADQLRAFAGSFTEGIDYYGKYISLGSDIDISGSNWEPIGGSYYSFAGTFDGAGYTISGLTEGSAEEPRTLNADSSYIGLFGILSYEARVKNVRLTNVYMNMTSPGTARAAGIAGRMIGSPIEGSYEGAVIDGCSVSGEMTLVQDDGNCFLAGIAAFDQKGAIINCRTDVKLSGTTLGEYIAEVGGLVGLLNRGLVANCYSLGDVYASGNRENSKEGMGAASGLVSVNGGTLAGSYSRGGHTTKELSTYTGAVSGWLTGIGKAYSCMYNEDAPMVLNGTKAYPVSVVGTIIPGGVSDDSDLVFAGGLTDNHKGFTNENYAEAADILNGYFDAYPADLTVFGLELDALKKWTYDEASDEVTFAEDHANVTYERPAVEFIPEEELVLKDGVWYGRDANKTTVVKITVENAEIASTEVLSGEASGDAYDEALYIARAKSAYGDFTHYEPVDPSRFAGGTGAKDDPYLVSNEEQLRYIATAINDDVDWHGAYFLQTDDIELHGEFIPIGWAKEVNIKHTWEILAYIFRGSYDGAGHTITGLQIGTKESPSEYMMAGLFGFTQGEWDNNLDPEDTQMPVTLKNIRLRDAEVHIKNTDQTYAGGLLGDGQNGIVIDNCSVTGNITASTEESHSRAAGLAASVLRGYVTDCWTDTEVYAETNLGRTYSGGMFSMTNRVSVINCYTLGNTSGRANTYGVTWVGGIDAFSGGIKVNCYSLGSETALTGTNGVGGINGLKGSISIDYLTYFNSDAEQTIAGTKVETNKSTGDNLTTPKATDEGAGKSAQELGSKEFADLLNANAKDMANQVARLEAELEGFYSVFYKGDGSDLNRWTVKDGVVCFADDDFVVEKTADGKLAYKASYDTSEVSEFYAAAYDSSGRLVSVVKNVAEGKLDNAASVTAYFWNDKHEAVKDAITIDVND